MNEDDNPYPSNLKYKPISLKVYLTLKAATPQVVYRSALTRAAKEVK